MYKGSDIVAACVAAHNIKRVYGYPGNYVLDIFHSLAEKGVELIVTAGEQGAIFAADGESRVSGRASLVIATSGPGATNLVTGIANAFMDSVPMVIITGNAPLKTLGGDCFQEIDNTGITTPITKYNMIVKSPDKLAESLDKAFFIAENGRKGPVLVDIPVDVSAGFCESAYTPAEITPSIPKTPDISELNAIVDLIDAAQKPIILAGGGASGSVAYVNALSLKLNAPIVTTMMSVALFPKNAGLNYGLLNAQNRDAVAAFKQADLLIALGTRFSDRTLRKLKITCPVIHIDSDEAELNKNVKATVLAADLSITVPLITRLTEVKHSNVELIADSNASPCVPSSRKGVSHNAVFDGLKNKFGLIVTDVGYHQVLTALDFPFSGEKLVTCGGFAPMGYAVSGAFGAYNADKTEPLVIIGDGGLTMNCSELYTAVERKVPMLIIVFNNRSLKLVEMQEDKLAHKVHAGTVLPDRDYAVLAAAFGAKGYTAYDDNGFRTALADALQADGVRLIDCKM